MKVPPQAVSQLITFLLAAQMRGWIDIRGLEPLLKIIVDSGNSDQVKGLLAEIIEMLDRVERGQSVR